MQSVTIAFNPIAGRGRARRIAEQAQAILAKDGFTVTLVEAAALRAAGARALEGSGALLICGGDGTLRSLLPCAVESRVPVQLLPAGNESLFARKFGISTDPQALLHLLHAPVIEEHHVAHANGEYFFTMASVGLDSCVIKELAARRSGPVGYRGYVGPILRSILRFRAPAISLTVDGVTMLRAERGFLIIANSPEYARSLNPVPEASSTAPFLHARFFPFVTLIDYLSWLPSLVFAKRLAHPDARLFSGRHFTLDGPATFPVQADGEHITALPLTVSATHLTLRVLVPPSGTAKIEI